MSTDQHVKPERPTDETSAGTDRPPSRATSRLAAGLDLSATKIIGGALAAMTAAALGSRLSVAGTVVGAALASIIAAVAGSVYTSSIRHTRERVRTVLTRSSDDDRSDQPTAIEVLTDDRGQVTGQQDWVVTVPQRTPRPARRRVQWKGILVGALAAFALAVGSLTVVELASGRALSGGDGTTLGQVSQGGPAVAEPTSTPTPSAAPSSTPSATPSASPTGAPTTPTPSAAEATATPSAEATPSASTSATPEPTSTP